MAIAKEYASGITNFDVDFKIDDSKLQNIVQKYDNIMPKFVEQVEKKAG